MFYPPSINSLPFECLQKILYEIEDEKSLYSCILVNRTWCQMAVPLLWYSPFHFLHNNDENSNIEKLDSPTSPIFPSNFTCSKVLIQTYLRCLPDSSITSLVENGLTLPRSITRSPPPLFPYSTYIRSISYSKIHHIVSEWFEAEIDDLEDIDEREGLEYLVTEKLIRLFIASSRSILELSLTDDDEIPSLPPISLFPNSENSLRNLVKLTCIGNYQYDMKDLLISLTEISRNIKEITIGGLSTSIEIKLFGKLIKSQKALKSIEILGNGPIDLQMISLDILQPLHTQQHSLENIKFVNCDFEECTTLYPMYLPMLKVIEFEKCRNLASFSDEKKLPKLQTFKAKDSYIPPLTLEAIFRNSHKSLRIIELSRKLSKDEMKFLLERIPTYCKRLEVLDIRIYQDNITSFINLLKYCENLKELTIYGDVYAEELLPLIAMNLCSKNLQKLCFIGRWIFSKISINSFLQGFNIKNSNVLSSQEDQINGGGDEIINNNNNNHNNNHNNNNSNSNSNSNNNNIMNRNNNNNNFKIRKIPKTLRFQSNDVINNDHLDTIVNWVFGERFNNKNGNCDLEKLELVWCQKLTQGLDVLERTERTKSLCGLVVEIN